MVIGGVSTAAILNRNEQVKPAYADPTETLTISGSHSLYVGETANFEAIASGFTPDSYSWSHTNEHAASIIATEGNTATIEGLHSAYTYLTVSAEGPNGTVTSSSFWIDIQEFEIMLQEDEIDMLPSMSMRFEVYTYDENGDVVFEVNSTNENAASAEIVSNNGNYLVVTAGSIEGISTTITINAKDNNGNPGYHTSSCSLTINVGENYEVGDRVLHQPNDDLLVFIANSDKTKFVYAENPYNSLKLGVTNDIAQASLFYLDSWSCLRLAFYTFHSQIKYINSNGQLSTNSGASFDDSYFNPDEPFYVDYPGVLSYYGNYLGIANYGPNEYVASSNSGQLLYPNHYEPIFAYVAVGHGPKITPDETSVDISEGGSTDIDATVAFVTDLDYEIVSGAACIDDVTISAINNLNQAEIHIETSNVTGSATIRIKDANDDRVYADITVNVIIDPEIAVCDLLTQTQLSYRYEPSGVDEYTYTDISIRFGGRISKAVWNEIEAAYDITGFGVMITAYEENLRDQFNISVHAGEAKPSTGEFNLHTDIVDYYMPATTMAVPPEDEDDYVWNLFHAVDFADITDKFTAVAYIEVDGSKFFFTQVKYSVCTLARDYLNNRGYDTDPAADSLEYLYELMYQGMC